MNLMMLGSTGTAPVSAEFVASTTKELNGGPNSVNFNNVDLGALGIEDGDLVFAYHAAQSRSSPFNPINFVGMADVNTLTSNNNVPYHAASYGFWSSSDSSTVSFNTIGSTSKNYTVHVCIFRGVTTYVDLSIDTEIAGPTRTIDPPAVTGSGTLAIIAAMNTVTSGTLTPPSGYTTTDGELTATGVTSDVSYKANPADDEDPGDYGVTSGNFGTLTVLFS